MEYVYFTMQMSSTYDLLHMSLSIASSAGELSSHSNVTSSYAMLNAIIIVHACDVAAARVLSTVFHPINK